MRLRLGILTTWCCLLACSLVSGKTVDGVSAKDDTSKLTNVRPTVAPLHRSTVKPTLAPLKPVTPTKAIILNIPPKSNGHTEEKKPPMTAAAALPQSETAIKDLKRVPETPNTLKGETSNAKPVQVTGFIAKNGNIYEIEDKDGIGFIEGRQSPADEKMNVCNYGNIVIYSDVPCDEVTNVRVGEVVETTVKDERDQQTQVQNQNQNQQQPQQQQQQQQEQLQQEQNHNNSEQKLDDVEEVKPLRRRNGQKRRRTQQNNQIRNRPNKNRNRNRRKSTVNRNQQNRRRPQTQQRRKQQQNRRRIQNQGYSTQRRRHNSNNRIQQRPRRRNRRGNKGRKGGNSSHNRRRNQRLQQKRRRQQEYGRERFDEDF